MGQVYVCGFAFACSMEYVAMLKKDRFPDDIAGKWTGVGGKVEHGEGIRTAMAREFAEEAGVETDPMQWTCFHTERHSNGNICHMLATRLTQEQEGAVHTAGHEPVELMQVCSVMFDLAEMVAEGKGSRDLTVFYAPVSYLLPMAVSVLREPAHMRNLGY